MAERTREINRLRWHLHDLDPAFHLPARQLKPLIQTHAAELLEIPGCAFLTAARIVGEVGLDGRFASDAQLARHAGTAPLPVSSGRTDRHRLSHRGARQLNSAIHRIAVTQIRCHPPAKDYLARRMAEGKTKREALRALKRFITRRFHRALPGHPT